VTPHGPAAIEVTPSALSAAAKTAEAAQERHFLEHPEDCGANVILRVII